MSSRVNLLEAWDEERVETFARPIGLVRLDANEVAVIPFTPEMVPVTLHYCEQAEIAGYVRCNGEGCVLCRAGRTKDERALLPVYVPASQSVGLLAISPSSRPGALKPPVMAALRSGRRLALLISRPDRAAFRVTTADLREGMDDGAPAIQAFRKAWDADQVDLAGVYPRYDNRSLAEVPGIATMLALKGVDLADLD
jgi:hypothetical protein